MVALGTGTHTPYRPTRPYGPLSRPVPYKPLYTSQHPIAPIPLQPLYLLSSSGSPGAAGQMATYSPYNPCTPYNAPYAPIPPIGPAPHGVLEQLGQHVVQGQRDVWEPRGHVSVDAHAGGVSILVLAQAPIGSHRHARERAQKPLQPHRDPQAPHSPPIYIYRRLTGQSRPTSR